VESALAARVAETGDPLGRGRERDAVAGLAAPGIEIPIARWVLQVPRGPKNTTFARSAAKSSVPRCVIASRLRECW
jgi:hypothetical protein